MATATQANAKGKGKAPIPTAKAAEGATKPKKAETAVAVIPSINSKALSKEVGPEVVRGLAKAEQDIAKAQEAERQGENAKSAYLAKLTMACIKASKADPTIDLTPAVSPDGDKKAMEMLNAQLFIVLGIKEVSLVTTRTGDKPKLDYTKDMKDFFVYEGSDKDSPEAKARGTMRTNFSHSLKHAAAVACGVIERKMTAEMDKQAGTLRLTGPEVKKQFGMSSVLLNEKQTVIPTVKGKATAEPVKLLEKPSFTAIRRKAEAAHGKAPPRTPVTARKGATPDDAVTGICDLLVETLAKIKGKLADKTVEAMRKASLAIAPHID